MMKVVNVSLKMMKTMFGPHLCLLVLKIYNINSII